MVKVIVIFGVMDTMSQLFTVWVLIFAGWSFKKSKTEMRYLLCFLYGAVIKKL
jgi:hypothetical protein